MSSRLLLHIGLPKTATTTLQSQYFPGLPADRYLYLGILQPRTCLQDSLFLRFRRAVYGEPEAFPVRNQLIERLRSGDRVVISEEMFTVSSPGVPWRDKLSHLARLVEGLDYTILVTVRPPVEASFSYYVELEPRFRAARMSYVDAVRMHESMEIFDYTKLARALDSLFAPERILFKRFDEVIAGNMADVDLLLGLRERAPTFNAFAVTNEKRRREGVVLTGRSETLADVMRRTTLARTLRESASAAPFLHHLKKLAWILDLVKFKERAVALPTSEELLTVSRILDPGWKELLTRMEASCKR